MANNSDNVSLTEFSELLCADETGADLGKVGRKFVQSMLLGISRSRSVSLTDISRAWLIRSAISAMSQPSSCRCLSSVRISFFSSEGMHAPQNAMETER